MTPYEFNLIREGYNKRREEQWELNKFQAWVLYASQTAAAGAEPQSFEDWAKPDDQPGKRGKITSRGRRISAKLKASLEAEMNKPS